MADHKCCGGHAVPNRYYYVGWGYQSHRIPDVSVNEIGKLGLAGRLKLLKSLDHEIDVL